MFFYFRCFPPCMARLFYTLSVVEVFRGNVGLSFYHGIEVCENRRAVCDLEVINIIGCRWVWMGDLARGVGGWAGWLDRLGGWLLVDGRGRLGLLLLCASPHSRCCRNAVHTRWKDYLVKNNNMLLNNGFAGTTCSWCLTSAWEHHLLWSSFWEGLEEKHFYKPPKW